MMATPLAAIILAAGKGTRMNSELPKVVHQAGGAPLVLWVAQACARAGCERIVLVVGYCQEHVREIFTTTQLALGNSRIEFAVQEEQLGTGHAARCAQPILDSFQGDIFVLVGDGPLLQKETLVRLHAHHLETSADLTLATAVLNDPDGYGRIVRDQEGRFVRIIEDKEASAPERALREINPSIYCFRANVLFDVLEKLEQSRTTGEYYITDVPELLLQEGRRVEVVPIATQEDAMSVNTPDQLREADLRLRSRMEQQPDRVHSQS